MQTVLITGGAGYLGSILTEKLLQEGYRVKVLDNFTYGSTGVKHLMKNKNIKIVKRDMRDLQIVLDTMNDVDAVIHLAAIVGDPASQLDPQKAFETNYLATKMLVDVSKHLGVQRFLFASTCSVYGVSNGRMLKETSKLKPLSLYAQSKLRSESVILDSMNKHFCPTIFRMGTLFGLSERMRFDLVINLFVAQAIKKKTISIEGGRQWRPFLHVSDAAESYILALQLPAARVRGVYNVGSENLNHQIVELGELVRRVIPDVRIKHKNIVDKRDYKVSFEKIRKELGFTPKYTVIDGIREIHHAFKSGMFSNWLSPIYYNNRYLLTGTAQKFRKYYFV